MKNPLPARASETRRTDPYMNQARTSETRHMDLS